MLFNQVDKGLNCKGIMLARNTKALFRRGGAQIALFDEIGLHDNLPGVTQKLFAICGRFNTLAGPVKKGYSQLGFKLFNCAAQGRLRDKELFSCGVNSTCLSNSKNVFELSQSHKSGFYAEVFLALFNAILLVVGINGGL